MRRVTKRRKRRSRDEDAVVVRLLACETRSEDERHGDMIGYVYRTSCEEKSEHYRAYIEIKTCEVGDRALM